MNEAERLADALDNAPVGNVWTEKAAAELRRLVAINAELVEALEKSKEAVFMESSKEDYEHLCAVLEKAKQ